jgi:hypothetical protein
MNIEDIVTQLTYDEMCGLRNEEEEGDEGSTSLERQKIKIFVAKLVYQRGNSNGKQGKTSSEDKKKDAYVKNDSFIELMWCKH